MSSLHSLRVSGLAVKANGQAVTVQSNNTPSVNIFNVDTVTQKIDIRGDLSASTLKGKQILTMEVSDASATVISLDTDVTIFNTATNTAVTIDSGLNGQLKYITNLNDGDITITKLGGGDLIGPALTNITLVNIGSSVILVYNSSLDLWVVLSNDDAGAFP